MSECFDLSFSFHGCAPGLEALEVSDSVRFVHPRITSAPSLRMFAESVGRVVCISGIVAAIVAE